MIDQATAEDELVNRTPEDAIDLMRRIRKDFEVATEAFVSMAKGDGWTPEAVAAELQKWGYDLLPESAANDTELRA